MAVVTRPAKNPLNIARSLRITRSKPIGAMLGNELDADEAEQENRSRDFYGTLQIVISPNSRQLTLDTPPAG